MGVYRYLICPITRHGLPHPQFERFSGRVEDGAIFCNATFEELAAVSVDVVL